MTDLAQGVPDHLPEDSLHENSGSEPVELTEEQKQEEAFAAGAFARIVRNMIVMTLVLPLVLYFRYGRAAALSLFLGSLIALFNFAALRKVISGIAEAATPARKARRLILVRFIARYALVGVAFYAIFRGSAVNLYGLVAGLSLPVPAVFIEAGYEVIHGFRKR